MPHPQASTLRPVERLLPLLRGVRRSGKGWVALCPGHDDQHASLSVAVGDDGRLLLRCHAGCELDTILAPVGLQTADLFPDRPSPARRLVAAYDYRDEQGLLLYQVVRFDPKDFRQRMPDGQDGWAWRLGTTTRVLYRLPELLAAPADQPVFVVEGEKDVEVLAGSGLSATTNVGGAGKWRPEYNRYFAGRHVVVLPDNDQPGREHARQVARALLDVAVSVRVLELPGLPPKGDVADWLQQGGDVATLQRLATEAPTASQWLAEAPAEVEADLLLAMAAVEPRAVEWLWSGRLALGKLAIFDGDPGLGKSLVALDLAARVSRGRPFPDGSPCAGGTVVIVNCEDGLADTLRPRLEGLGADLKRVLLFRGRRVAGAEQLPSFPRDLGRLERAVRTVEARLVVIDPIMAFLDETICTGNDQSVRQALSPLAQLAEATGCAVLLIRHLNKTGTGKALYRGGGSIGIVGACRSAWLIARHPEDVRQCVLAQLKNNLGPAQRSLGYEVVPDEQGRPQVAWLGEVALGADRLLGPPRSSAEAPAKERAAELLRDALRDGPRPVREVVADLAGQGVDRRTLYRAREAAGVISRPEETDGRRVVWQLNADDEDAPETPSDPNAMGPYAEGY